jgi:hypothetical protein
VGDHHRHRRDRPARVGGLGAPRRRDGRFATSEIVFLKQIGVGTVVAVLVDAFVVRALLVPSLMALLGDRNWWSPRVLRRLHARGGLSEGVPAPA